MGRYGAKISLSGLCQAPLGLLAVVGFFIEVMRGEVGGILVKVGQGGLYGRFANHADMILLWEPVRGVLLAVLLLLRLLWMMLLLVLMLGIGSF
jgi:hypothetical protein